MISLWKQASSVFTIVNTVLLLSVIVWNFCPFLKVFVHVLFFKSVTQAISIGRLGFYPLLQTQSFFSAYSFFFACWWSYCKCVMPCGGCGQTAESFWSRLNVNRQLSRWLTKIRSSEAIGLPFVAFGLVSVEFCGISSYVSIPKLASGTPEDGRESRAPSLDRAVSAEPSTAMAGHQSHQSLMLSMWAGIAVAGTAVTHLVLDIKERVRKWSRSHLGFICCLDSCNGTFFLRRCRAKRPKRDAAPAKCPCPWQHHPLVHSGETWGMTDPHCWALQKAVLCKLSR